ncbi:hypothetical protein [Maribacter cobaltidurans]|jgi:hypothetical protein|uniref:Uncharacterized protein n=1 Tax=Maribacter cobaltidurans TaxID=1178778 RepID=A0A223V6N0_9FLAO|nr:hypothetical protein [Maribacter cobaltidurans]ASV30966.1 hypothetical protein CJ263_12475 [Maribacter cobaltidurans]GGD90084.1 hypothetical protein GCM10011412_30080 [Maribacter cobaltidurans]
MEGGLVSDKLLNALVDSLSVEDLQAIMSQKIAKECADHKPKPMTEREKLKKHYRNLFISMGKLHL